MTAGGGDSATKRAIEQIARDSYGRLVAIIAARTGDIASAEDALSEAFRKALETWPSDGAPDNRLGWLVTTAKRTAIDEARGRDRHLSRLKHLEMLELERREQDPTANRTDPRLRLMFACSHPAIDRKARAPLILQTVLGVDAKRMAPVFLVSPNALGQRLARAKAKIREAGVSFDLPAGEDWRERVDSLLNAIYAAYTLGWDAEFTTDAKLRSLSNEAAWLARVLAELLPEDPEVLGLLALILFTDARRSARRDAETGTYIPLTEQDAGLWDEAANEEAEALLRAAGLKAEPGRFQIEAAIQAVHAHRRRSGNIDWSQIEAFHTLLHANLDTIGSGVALAGTRIHTLGPRAALELLDYLAASFEIGAYQPYWATRAAALAALGRQDAGDAWARAAALSSDPAVKSYLRSWPPANHRRTLLK